MEVREHTTWRMTSTAKAREAVAVLIDAGHEAKARGRSVTVGYHPAAIDGARDLIATLDPDAVSV